VFSLWQAGRFGSCGRMAAGMHLDQLADRHLGRLRKGQAASLLVLEGGERKEVLHNAISEGKVAF